jgi:hypothetical protein
MSSRRRSVARAAATHNRYLVRRFNDRGEQKNGAAPKSGPEVKSLGRIAMKWLTSYCTAANMLQRKKSDTGF